MIIFGNVYVCVRVCLCVIYLIPDDICGSCMEPEFCPVGWGLCEEEEEEDVYDICAWLVGDVWAIGTDARFSCTDDVECSNCGCCEASVVFVSAMEATEAAGARGGGRSSRLSSVMPSCWGRFRMGGGCWTVFCLAPMSGAPLSTLLCFPPMALTNVCSAGAATAVTVGDDVTDDDDADEPDPVSVLLSEVGDSLVFFHCCCCSGVVSLCAVVVICDSVFSSSSSSSSSLLLLLLLLSQLSS